MNYLQDKKTKRKKFLLVVFLCVFLLILFYPGTKIGASVHSRLSSLTHFIFRPILVFGNNIGGKLGGFVSYFVSKDSLYLENQELKSQLGENEAKMFNYDSVSAENVSLKEILGRKNEKSMTLSAILSKPNLSPYDTLIIDAGINQGLQAGDKVFALGDVPIGAIAETHLNSSKVVLFSNAGEKTQVVIGDKNIFMELVGRGGGNFEMIIPRDLTLVKGDQAVMPGIAPYVVGIVETIISDPRDPFIKALLVSPVNIQELKFVQIETRK